MFQSEFQNEILILSWIHYYKVSKICNSDVTNEDGISVERTVQGDNGSKLVGSSYREESGLIGERNVRFYLEKFPRFLSGFYAVLR